jgi:2-oxoglutarate ferredoxin oxidoreductase subunit alpha
MPSAGEGYRVFVESLTHDERGYPVINAEAQGKMVNRLTAKITSHRKQILSYEERDTEDADTIVLSYGISARIAARAVAMARREGIRAGLFRLITAWPFPEERIQALSGQVKRFIVPEINMGQMVYEVERCAAGRADVVLVPHAGGDIHHPEAILEAII